MQQLVDTLNKYLRADDSERQECNYKNDYYGDQVCKTVNLDAQETDISDSKN